MTSEVAICNLALSHLGDSATVASISPPDGSIQAEHCARFYPLARDAMLEARQWGFATTRVALAQLTSESPSWDYCYALPNSALNIIAVLPPDADDDYTGAMTVTWPYAPPVVGEVPTQPFVCETLASGATVVYTDQPSAVVRYTLAITDPSKFTPLFVTALSWLLASHVAGPLLKGEAGRSAASTCMGQYTYWMEQATESDANQRRVRPNHTPTWIAVR